MSPLIHLSNNWISLLGVVLVTTTTVLWLFLAAMVVDGTDGMLARRWRVKEVVPWFDGALLDNIVDYITYAFAPMVPGSALGEKRE